jgi:LL-diaminopimelate aminotransferase
MLFAGRAQYSVLQAPGAIDCAIEFHSFSKSFQMAGCRIGFVVGNADVIAALAKLKANIDYGVFLAVQEAAMVALEEASDQPPVADLYEERSRFFVAELHRFGWEVKQPEATMFVWARLPEGWSSREFARQLLLHTGVVVTPGAAFGQAGEGFVRIALVQELDQLAVATRRIESFWKEHVYANN